MKYLKTPDIVDSIINIESAIKYLNKVIWLDIGLKGKKRIDDLLQAFNILKDTDKKVQEISKDYFKVDYQREIEGLRYWIGRRIHEAEFVCC